MRQSSLDRRTFGSRGKPSTAWKQATAIAVVLAIILVTPLRVPFRSLAIAVVTPVWALGHATLQGLETFFGGFAGNFRLANENNKLKTEIASLRAESWRNDVIKDERDNLREFLGRSTSTDPMVLGYVLAAPNRAPYDTLIVDVGTDTGIFPGAHVETDGGFVVGVVREVFERYSIIELYSSPGETHDVVVGASRIPAVAHGVGGGNLQIELPKNTDIQEGDAVSVQGEGDRFLGVVEHILVDEKTGITTLLLRLPVNMSELDSVMIDLLPSTI